jgi:fucose 4-O-acetylase-like acetyltransferase
LTASQTLQTPGTNPPAVAGIPPQRSLLIDILRGLSIALVVLGHTDEGTLHRFWWNGSMTGYRIKYFIYSFHMPAFFFVSGIFLCASVQKRGGWRFTIEKLRTMIYPYLLWALIYAPIPIYFSKVLRTAPISWATFAGDVATGSYAWFLPTIFFTVVVGMLVRRVPIPLLFVLSALISLYWPYTGLVFVDRGLNHLPFLVVGMWVGRSFEQVERVPAVLAAVGAAVLFVMILLITKSHFVFSPYLFIPLGLLGTLMLLLVSRVLARTPTARLLAWTGSGSIGIFLLSSYFQAIGRETLVRVFHTARPYPQLIFPSLLALLVPAWIYQNRVRLHMDWMFVWPFTAAHTAVVETKPAP